MKLASVIIVCALFSSNIAHSDPVINNEYVPVAEAIGGASGVRINSDGEYVFYNEKPYAVTAEVLMSDNTIVAITLPPRSTGPIETASGILDQPVSTLASYLTGSFGQSEVNAGTLTASEIKSITYVGGRDEAQLLNLAYLATSTIQTTAQALSFSGNDKAVFDLVGETIIKKITSEEVSGRILQKMSNGCGFLTSCRSFLSKELKSITLEVIEEIATSVLFEEILFVNGVSSSDASDFLLRKTPVIKALDYLTILENFGDIGALLSGTIAFSGTPTTLRVQTVTDDDLAPPLQYNYDEFPEIIAQIEVIEEPVFLSAPNDPSNIPEALVATAPDITDDIIADLVEEADPDEPVTPEPVLVGVFSGVNGTPSSNLAIQGTLSNVVETSTGNASFEITGDCVSGCTVTGTTPEPEASSYSHLSWGRLSQTVRMTDSNTGITHDIQNMRWLYGDATSSDYLNTRTGTASYAGQIYGDLTEGGVTQYNTITGGIGLSFNFSDDTLSGQAYVSQGGVPQEGFNIAGGLTSSGGQQYLQGSLTSQNSASTSTGGLLGAFYGPEATELGGAIWVFSDEFAVGGVFVASSGETFVMPDIYYGDTHTRITANKIGFGVYDSDNFDGNGDTINIQPSLGGGSVTKTETFAASGYSYSSWGKWTADAGNINPDYAQGGYWSETQTTPASVVQNRTGTASYSGNIVGDFVSSAGVRDDARGLININADFSNQSVSGQMQFGHDCGGGSGPSGCNVISGVESFNEAINDYGGSGFGSHSTTVNTTGSGVVGIFAGPNAEEIAGTAWMNDNGGLYNGVFIAGQ